MTDTKELTQHQKLDFIIEKVDGDLPVDMNGFYNALCQRVTKIDENIQAVFVRQHGITEDYKEAVESTIKESGKALIEVAKSQIELSEDVAALTNKIEQLDDTNKGVEKYLAEQSERIIWIQCLVQPIAILLFCFAVLLVFQSKGCNSDGVQPNPKPAPPIPAPIEDKIYCDSQAEMNVILSALRVVEKEQSNFPDRALSEAIESLDVLMGGPKDGVKQETQEKVLVEFTGGKSFTDAVAEVKIKLTLR